MEVRKARREEIELIANFQVLMAKETENLTLQKKTVCKGVKALFEHPERGEYIVALRDGEVVGCLLLLPEWSDWRCGTVLWIHSVYVVKKARRQGVYTLLYEHVKNRVAQDPELKGIRLYVDESNKKAQSTYEALGMNGNHYRLYEWLKG